MPDGWVVGLDFRLELKVYGRSMSLYRISEAAQKAGLTASALRFYESSGLLPNAARTPAGYRTYDDAAVERLRFVHRARTLGLPLEEIRSLVEIWDAGPCAPVQQDLAEHIALRRRSVQERIVELQLLADQLRDAERAVLDAPGDGGCGSDCACLAGAEVNAAGKVGEALRRIMPGGLIVLPQPPSSIPILEEPPLACTLAAGEMPDRLRTWRGLVSEAVSRERVAGGERLVFAPAQGLAARVAGLCELEQSCCAFFTFTVTVSAAAVILDVTAPDGAAPLLDALLDGRS